MQSLRFFKIILKLWVKHITSAQFYFWKVSRWPSSPVQSLWLFEVFMYSTVKCGSRQEVVQEAWEEHQVWGSWPTVTKGRAQINTPSLKMLAKYVVTAMRRGMTAISYQEGGKWRHPKALCVPSGLTPLLQFRNDHCSILPENGIWSEMNFSELIKILAIKIILQSQTALSSRPEKSFAINFECRIWFLSSITIWMTLATRCLTKVR